MTHTEFLQPPQRITPSLFGSIVFHVMLGAAIVGVSWVENHDRITLGDPNGGRFGSVSINPVATIPLPAREAPKNPVATDTENTAPTPVPKSKPTPRVKLPDPDAIALPSRDAKKKASRPSEFSPESNKFRSQQKDQPNQTYSTVSPRVSTPDYGIAGGGNVGLGTSSPFGTQFGAYADLLRTRVAEKWNTSDIRAGGNPVVGVTFTLHRDGSATGVRLSQKSGNSALDISAQRAVFDASPFPPMPPQFPKDAAEIEFLFQLKR
jgi:protein TonB